MTLTNVYFTSNSATKGGGLYNYGTATLNNVNFSGNLATSGFSSGGGGLYNNGTVTLTNDIFSGNGGTQGGGLYNDGTATRINGVYHGPGAATLLNVAFSNNSAFHAYSSYSQGGGLFNFGGSVTLSNVSFTSNLAANGGGLYNYTNNITSIYSNGNVTYEGIADITLTNVIFSSNRANDEAGGLSNDGTATLTNVNFSSNSAGSAGGGGGGGGFCNVRGTAKMTNVVFSNNTTSSGREAGGMEIKSGTAILNNTTFTGNTSAYGGLHNSGTAILTNVSFIGNLSQSVYCGGMDNVGTAMLTNVNFSSNSGGNGGGLFNEYQATVTLTNVSFSGNSATYYGGGLFNYGRATLTNVSFTRNSALSGGGLYNYQSPYGTGPVTLTNSILWGDSGGEIFGSGVTVSYSDIQGGSAGTGNINVDPMFVDPTHGNLHLQAGSPAIDTGTNADAPNFDLDGNPRPVDATGKATAITDMGAYEFQNPQPMPLVAVGTQAGVPAYVALYNSKDQRYTLQPYGNTFTGGIQVAVADVNEDGVVDLIVAPGPGGSPTVKVYSGSNGTLLDSFNAYGSSFTGGLFVAAADVLDLGAPQLIVGPGAGGSPYVQVFDLRNNPPRLAQSLQVFDNSFTGGLTVGASNGVVVAGAASESANVKVFDQPNLSRVRLFGAFGTGFTGGVTVAATGQYLAVGQMAGTSLANVFNLIDLTLASTIVPEFGIPHDPAYMGGTSVNWARETSGAFDLLTGTGPGWPALVQYWVAGSWQRRTSFSDFGGYPGGIWVA